LTQALHGVVYRALGIQNRICPTIRRSGPHSSCVEKHRPFPPRRIGGLNNRVLNSLMVHGHHLLAKINENRWGEFHLRTRQAVKPARVTCSLRRDQSLTPPRGTQRLVFAAQLAFRDRPSGRRATCTWRPDLANRRSVRTWATMAHWTARRWLIVLTLVSVRGVKVGSGSIASAQSPTLTKLISATPERCRGSRPVTPS
jgi:hypothetical protein